MPRSTGCGRSAMEHFLGHPIHDCISHEKLLYYELSKWDNSSMENKKTEESVAIETNNKLSFNNAKRHFSLSSCLLKKLRSIRVRKQGVNSNIGLTQLPIGQRQPKNKTKWQQRRDPKIEKYQADSLQNDWQSCEGQQNGCQLPNKEDFQLRQESEKHQKEGQYLQSSETQVSQLDALQSTDNASHCSEQSIHISGAGAGARRALAPPASCWRGSAPATSSCAKQPLRTASKRLHHRSLRDSNCYPRQRRILSSCRVKQALGAGLVAAALHCVQERQSNAQMQQKKEKRNGKLTLIAAPATTTMARLWVAAVTEPAGPPAAFKTTSDSTIPAAPKPSTASADDKTSSVTTEPVEDKATKPQPLHARFEVFKEPSLSPTSTLSLVTASLLESTQSDTTESTEPDAPSYVAANDRAYWFFRNRRTLGVQTTRERRAPGRGTPLLRAGHLAAGGGGRVCIQPCDEDLPPPPPCPPLCVALEHTSALASRLVAGTSHCFTELQKKLFSQNNSREQEKIKTQFTQYDVKDINVESVFPFAADQFRVLVSGKMNEQDQDEAGGGVVSWAAPAPERLSSTLRSPPPSCYCQRNIKGISCQVLEAALSTSELNHPKNTKKKKKMPIWRRCMKCCFQRKNPMCTCLSKKNNGLRCLRCKNKSCKCSGACECSACKQTHKQDPFHDPNFVQLIEDEVNYRNALGNKVKIFRKTNTNINKYSSDKTTPIHSKHIFIPRPCQWRRKPSVHPSVDTTAKCSYCTNLGSNYFTPPEDNPPCICQPLSLPEEPTQSQTTITGGPQLCGWKYDIKDGKICKACYKPICKCNCKPGKETKPKKANGKSKIKPKADNLGQTKQILQERIGTPHQTEAAKNTIDRATSPMSIHESKNIDQYAMEKSSPIYDQHSTANEKKEINLTSSEHDIIQPTNIHSQKNLDDLSKTYSDKLTREGNIKDNELHIDTEEKKALGDISTSKDNSIQGIENKVNNKNTIATNTSNDLSHLKVQGAGSFNQSTKQDESQQTEVHSEGALQSFSSKSQIDQMPQSIENNLLNENVKARNKTRDDLKTLGNQDSENLNQYTMEKRKQQHYQQQQLDSKNKSRDRNKQDNIDSPTAFDSSSTQIQLHIDKEEKIYSESLNQHNTMEKRKQQHGQHQLLDSKNESRDSNKQDTIDSPTAVVLSSSQNQFNKRSDNIMVSQRTFGTNTINDTTPITNSYEQGTCCQTIFKNISDHSTNYPCWKELSKFPSPQNKSNEHSFKDTCCQVRKIEEIKSSDKAQQKQNYVTNKTPSQYSTKETVDKLHFTIEQENSSNFKKTSMNPSSSSKIKKTGVICQCEEGDLHINTSIPKKDKSMKPSSKVKKVGVICQCDEQDLHDLKTSIPSEDIQLNSNNRKNVQNIPANTVIRQQNKVDNNLENGNNNIFTNSHSANKNKDSHDTRNEKIIKRSIAVQTLPPRKTKEQNIKRGQIHTLTPTSDKSTISPQNKKKMNGRQIVTNPSDKEADETLIRKGYDNLAANRVGKTVSESLLKDYNKRFINGKVVYDRTTQTETVIPDRNSNITSKSVEENVKHKPQLIRGKDRVKQNPALPFTTQSIRGTQKQDTRFEHQFNGNEDRVIQSPVLPSTTPSISHINKLKQKQDISTIEPQFIRDKDKVIKNPALTSTTSPISDTRKEKLDNSIIERQFIKDKDRNMQNPTLLSTPPPIRDTIKLKQKQDISTIEPQFIRDKDKIIKSPALSSTTSQMSDTKKQRLENSIIEPQFIKDKDRNMQNPTLLSTPPPIRDTIKLKQKQDISTIEPQFIRDKDKIIKSPALSSTTSQMSDTKKQRLENSIIEPQFIKDKDRNMQSPAFLSTPPPISHTNKLKQKQDISTIEPQFIRHKDKNVESPALSSTTSQMSDTKKQMLDNSIIDPQFIRDKNRNMRNPALPSTPPPISNRNKLKQKKDISTTEPQFLTNKDRTMRIPVVPSTARPKSIGGSCCPVVTISGTQKVKQIKDNSTVEPSLIRDKERHMLIPVLPPTTQPISDAINLKEHVTTTGPMHIRDKDKLKRSPVVPSATPPITNTIKLKKDQDSSTIRPTQNIITTNIKEPFTTMPPISDPQKLKHEKESPDGKLTLKKINNSNGSESLITTIRDTMNLKQEKKSTTKIIPVEKRNQAILKSTSENDKSIIKVSQPHRTNQTQDNETRKNSLNEDNMDKYRNFNATFLQMPYINSSSYDKIIAKPSINSNNKQYIFDGKILCNKTTQTETPVSDIIKDDEKTKYDVSMSQFKNGFDKNTNIPIIQESKKIRDSKEVKFIHDNEKTEFDHKKTNKINEPDSLSTKSKMVITDDFNDQNAAKNIVKQHVSEGYISTSPITSTRKLKQDKDSSTMKPAELTPKIYTKRVHVTRKGKPIFDSIDIRHQTLGKASNKSNESSVNVLNRSSLITNSDAATVAMPKSVINEHKKEYGKQVSLDKTSTKQHPLINNTRSPKNKDNYDRSNYESYNRSKQMPQKPVTKDKIVDTSLSNNDNNYYFTGTNKQTGITLNNFNKMKDSSTNTEPLDFLKSQNKKCLLGCNTCGRHLNIHQKKSPDMFFYYDKLKAPNISKNKEIRRIDDIEIKSSPFIQRDVLHNSRISIPPAKNSNFKCCDDDILVIKKPSEDKYKSNHSYVESSMPSNIYQFNYFDKVNLAKTHPSNSPHRVTVNKNINTVSLSSTDIVRQPMTAKTSKKNSQADVMVHITKNLYLKKQNYLHTAEELKIKRSLNKCTVNLQIDKPLQKFEAGTSTLSLEREYMNHNNLQRIQSHVNINIRRNKNTNIDLNKIKKDHPEKQHRVETKSSNKQSVAVQFSTSIYPEYIFDHHEAKAISFLTLYKYLNQNYSSSEMKGSSINYKNIRIKIDHPRDEDNCEVFGSKSSLYNLFETCSEVSNCSGEDTEAGTFATSLSRQRPGRHCLRAVLDARIARAATCILGQPQH